MLIIRNYISNDYPSIKALYLQSELYGGKFDNARDSAEKMASVTKRDPQAVLVCEQAGDIVGTVSLIEDSRVAFLFRFAVMELPNKYEITSALDQAACAILRSRNHEEVLVYAPLDNPTFEARYAATGMTKGSAYRCYWKSLKT